MCILYIYICILYIYISLSRGFCLFCVCDLPDVNTESAMKKFKLKQPGSTRVKSATQAGGLIVIV